MGPLEGEKQGVLGEARRKWSVFTKDSVQGCAMIIITTANSGLNTAGIERKP